MTQCPYENVSFIFCFLKCCADISQRNTSQRPLELTSDGLRLGRVQSSISSVRREMDARRPPLVGRGRGGTRLARVDASGASTSQTGPSQMVDRRSLNSIMRSISRRKIRLIMRSLNNIILMRISSISMRIISISLILSRSNLILSRLSSRRVGVMLKGCRLWSTRPDGTTMDGAFCAHAFTSLR